MLASAYFVDVPTSGGGGATGESFPELDENSYTTLNITYNDQQLCSVFVKGIYTVGEVKKQIVSFKKLNTEKFNLYYNGGLLRDNRALSTYYIRKESELLLKTISE